MARKPNRVFFSRPRKFFSRALAPIIRKSQSTLPFATKQIKLRPITTFLVLLTALFILIALSHQITKPKKTDQNQEVITKEVATFNIGSAPTITLHAQVQKSGVVQIVAQAPGIISKIHITEGKSVKRGQTLISTGSNYLGANAQSIQRQLAQTQYSNAKDTFELQKELIGKQRELADKTDLSQDQLRDITNKSLGETKDLISLNENILATIDANLKTLEDTNTGGVNDNLILQTKQLKAQLLAGLNQAKNSLRSAEFTSSSDKAPSELSNLGRDVAQKQLDLQEKSLELGLESTRLGLKLAQISESVMFPSAPFAAIVQRVHVRTGQTVSPGTPLVTLSTQTGSISATALVPRNIAQSINKLQNSYLIIGNNKIEQNPTYISTEATNGQLYSVVFLIAEKYQDKLTDMSFIDINVPIGYEYSSGASPFVPLDAVHQTQDEAIVMTIENDTAQGKKVTLGEVMGSYVQITSGLINQDVVILDRNVVALDKVKAVIEK